MRTLISHTLFAAALLLFAGCGDTGKDGAVSPPDPGCRLLAEYFHTSAIIPSDAASGAAVGNGFVYIADGDAGVRVIDISDPGAPVARGMVDTVRAPIDIDVAGNTLYVAWGRTGFVVVDVGDPDRPVITGAVPTPGGAVDVTIRDGFAYVADDVIGLVVIDASVPDSARVTGVENTPGRATGVALLWPLAVVSDATLGVRVVNVEDPENPWLVSTVPTPGTAQGIATARGYAYVADGEGGLQIFDPSSSSDGILSTVMLPGEPIGLTANDGVLYVVDRVLHRPPETAYAGLELLDLTDPLQPAPINRNETAGITGDVFVSSGIAVAADGTKGVRVMPVRLSTPPPATRSVLDPAGDMRDVVSHRSLLYLADAGRGLVVTEASGLRIAEVGMWTGIPAPIDVAAMGDTVFVADGAGLVAAVDVSNPAGPAFAFDVPASAGTISMSVSGRVLYMARGLSAFTEFVAYSDDDPRGVALQAYATASARFGDFIYVVTRQGSFIIVGASTLMRIGATNEFGAGEAIVIRVEDDPLLPKPRAFVAILRGDNGPGVAVVDILNGGFPRLITHIPTPTAALDIAFHQSLMYVALGNGGLEVFDISSVDAAKRVGFFPAEGGIRRIALDDGNVFAADGSAGVLAAVAGVCAGNR